MLFHSLSIFICWEKYSQELLILRETAKVLPSLGRLPTSQLTDLWMFLQFFFYLTLFFNLYSLAWLCVIVCNFPISEQTLCRVSKLQITTRKRKTNYETWLRHLNRDRLSLKVFRLLKASDLFYYLTIASGVFFMVGKLLFYLTVSPHNTLLDNFNENRLKM